MPLPEELMPLLDWELCELVAVVPAEEGEVERCAMPATMSVTSCPAFRLLSALWPSTFTVMVPRFWSDDTRLPENRSAEAALLLPRRPSASAEPLTMNVICAPEFSCAICSLLEAR